MMKFAGRFSRFDRKPKANDTEKVFPHSINPTCMPPTPAPAPVAEKLVKRAHRFPKPYWQDDPHQPELIFEDNGSVGLWWEYTCKPDDVVCLDKWWGSEWKARDHFPSPPGTGGLIHYRLQGLKPGMAEISFFQNFRNETITHIITYRVEVDSRLNATILQTFAPR